jgi:hypothetical protein
METVRQVVVLDAADLAPESAFWAGVLGGRVFADDTFHSVIDAAGEWRIGVQLAPDHVPPDWPDGSPQQVHLDLHVVDPRAAHQPFCIGWGHPSREALAQFVAGQSRADRLTREPQSSR